jgi:hypothetical protein
MESELVMVRRISLVESDMEQAIKTYIEAHRGNSRISINPVFLLS